MKFEKLAFERKREDSAGFCKVFRLFSKSSRLIMNNDEFSRILNYFRKSIAISLYFCYNIGWIFIQSMSLAPYAVLFKDFSRLKGIDGVSMNIFLFKGVFMRNEQRSIDSAERHLQGV